jgi:hypothetical protein
VTSAAHVVPRSSAGPLVATSVVAMMVLATGVLLVLGEGTIGVAFVPVVVAVFLYALWALPLRVTVLSLFAIGLIVEVPNERPAEGRWQSPVYKIGAFLYDNLNNVVGVEALRFSGLDLLVGAMVLLLLTRAWRERGYQRDTPAANVLVLSLVIAFVAVVWIEAFGMSRGGDFKQSLWQLRPILWTPVIAGIFAYALRGPEDFRTIGKTVVIAAMVKAAMGLWVLLTIIRPNGIDHMYVTTHSDSVLYVSAIAVCFAWWAHRPTMRNMLFYGGASLWIVLGIVANNRRIAWVGLIAAMWVMIAVLKRGRVKRAIATMLVVMSPFIAIYLVLGSRSQSGFFAPAGSIVSVFTQTDASSGTRDIENYNLMMTLRPNPLLGTGLGHEYNEVSRAYDITGAFSQYRYIGHNSVLWLWSVAGYLGFTAIWLTIVVAVFLARRSYALATRASDRVASAWVLAVIAAYLVQAWGDMGMHGWVVVMLMSAALALSGKLAVATGAWPTSMRLTGRRQQPLGHGPQAPIPVLVRPEVMP